MGQAAYRDFVIEIARRLSEQQSFQPLPRRWVVEVVLTQWTKADVLTRKADGQHIVDFDLVARDDDTVNEQQHKLPALLEGGLRQPVLQPLAKGLQGGCDTGQLLLALRIVAQELLLISQRLLALLQVAALLVLVEWEDWSCSAFDTAGEFIMLGREPS
ncbi:hypothetical protein ACD578_26145 (plasmid) [Microvirga sp. RSM25]|uniref:hypothetical protein n=1 Tax=Microvirga sp. RSM25 TaxID=3273802 RepID=UPI00384F286D